MKCAVSLVLNHKKLFIAILAVLLVLVTLQLLWVFKPKLSTLSDAELQKFIQNNGIELEAPLQIDDLRSWIAMMEEIPGWLPSPVTNGEQIFSDKQHLNNLKLNNAVNKYYGRTVLYQYAIAPWEEIVASQEQ